MFETFWASFRALPIEQQLFFFVALAVALGFEFINGFHDTANAVTTVIYTHSLKPTHAVIYSGVCNFLGVVLGGTAIAFAIVNLLPVDLLVDARPKVALAMVLSLLIAGVLWNLGTWYIGLPVSSSHTLIGSILGVGLANTLITRGDLAGVNWSKAGEVGLSLLVSPLIGFVLAGGLLLLLKRIARDPRLYVPPEGQTPPPRWIRWTLIGTCGGVSFAHGSNDGQKGMGLILLVLIGFLPTYYALDLQHHGKAEQVRNAAIAIEAELVKRSEPIPAEVQAALETLTKEIGDRKDLREVPAEKRWQIRQALFQVGGYLDSLVLTGEQKKTFAPHRKALTSGMEFVPWWVVIGVALALGIGTMVGYQRIVVTVAEKIGKTHLTYAQGACAEVVAASTIGIAAATGLPVSTTHVLSSGVAGTMVSNGSGIQSTTIQKIGLAWVMTLPACTVLAGSLFLTSRWLLG